MIFYHADRANSLSAGQMISPITYDPLCGSFGVMANKLFDCQISMHGNQYLGDSPSNGIPDMTSSLIEFSLELVRRSFFPQMPSRYQSIFAVSDLSHFAKWKALFHAPFFTKIWEVEASEENYIELDASMLPHGFFNVGTRQFSPSLLFEGAYRYWSGAKSDEPQLECLLPLPVKVLREIPLPNDLT